MGTKNKFCYIYICLAILPFNNAFSQRFIEINNTNTHKKYQIKSGDQAILSYSGYLKQEELISGIVNEITDSSIILIHIGPKDPSMILGYYSKAILIKDIHGFRKIPLMVPILKNTIRVATAVGTAFLFSYLLNNGINTTYSLLICAGAGLATNISLPVFFPETIKHELKNGWELKIINE